MVSDQLYHIKRTITDFNPSLTNHGYTVDILGTYTDLALAKEAARSALFSEGYLASDFEIYNENNGDENWVHGDGVKVYAKAYAGQVLEVMIDTKPNTEGWWSSKGEFEGCDGGLYYGSFASFPFPFPSPSLFLSKKKSKLQKLTRIKINSL